MSVLALASHVADVAPQGVPYIGEGAWGVPWRSSRTRSRPPGPSSNSGKRWAAGRRGSTEGNPRPALDMFRRITRAWPKWSKLRGRRHSNPADQRLKYR